MKKYIIFDLDWTLINSTKKIDGTIINYVEKNIWKDFSDSTKYFLKNNAWATLYYLFLYLWFDEKDSNLHSKILFEELNKLKNITFIDWVIEKILELEKKYILFLSTWSSTTFAEKVLKEWWIYNSFEKIMWSDLIPKSVEHINIFQKIINDENFCKYAISVWDWQKEKEISIEKNIDFIHIWNKENNKYKINSVAKIDNIINQINKWLQK